MKLFECRNCGQLRYFEDTLCEHCGQRLGYLADHASLITLSAGSNDGWRASPGDGDRFRFCANAVHNACNWLLPLDSPDMFCQAWALNRTIPNLEKPGNLLFWQQPEGAKHRLVYSLLRFRLPLTSKQADLKNGLAFDFLEDSDNVFKENEPVITGHAQGLITITIAEADDALRERHGSEMTEPYRRALGHFRHEIGHHYWERLVRNGGWHEAFRDLFGDERLDYGDALEVHYAKGPKSDWQARHVSSYASCHPWEDFAETWVHYLHIVETLETAGAFGMKLQPGGRMRSWAGDADRFRSLSAERFRQPDRRLVAAHLRGQQPQPTHGPARSLPLHPGSRSPGQTAFHPRSRL